MAGDWIPMRVDLAEDPAVIAIAEATGLDEFAVIGRLHRLWSWANSQLKDGHATSVTAKWVDRYVNAVDFASSMVKARWLTLTPKGVTFPKFDEWNSQGGKRRLLAAKRQRKSRHADVTQSTQQKCDQRREEESRVKNPPKPPAVEEPDGFDRFWSAWPKRVAKEAAVRAWRALKPSPVLIETIIADVVARSTSEQWAREGRRVVPNPATYLNQKRWQDEQPSPSLNGSHDPELARRYAGDRGDEDLG